MVEIAASRANQPRNGDAWWVIGKPYIRLTRRVIAACSSLHIKMCDISNWDADQRKTDKHYVNYNDSPAVRRYAFESEKDGTHLPVCRTLLELTRDGVLRVIGTYDNEIKMTLTIDQVRGWAERWDKVKNIIAEFGWFKDERMLHEDDTTREKLVAKCRSKGNWPALLVVKTSYTDDLMRNNYGIGCFSLNLKEINMLTCEQLNHIVEDMELVAADAMKYAPLAPKWGPKNPFCAEMAPQLQVASRDNNVKLPESWKTDKNHPFNQLSDAEIQKFMRSIPGV
jgi:hypothetical protein